MLALYNQPSRHQLVGQTIHYFTDCVPASSADECGVRRKP